MDKNSGGYLIAVDQGVGSFRHQHRNGGRSMNDLAETAMRPLGREIIAVQNGPRFRTSNGCLRL
jgi:hypothetical protein